MDEGVVFQVQDFESEFFFIDRVKRNIRERIVARKRRVKFKLVLFLRWNRGNHAQFESIVKFCELKGASDPLMNSSNSDPSDAILWIETLSLMDFPGRGMTRSGSGISKLRVEAEKSRKLAQNSQKGDFERKVVAMFYLC